MTQDAVSALEELWRSYVVLFALALTIAGMFAFDSPGLNEAVEPAAVQDPKWAALWKLLLIGYAAYMLRRYFWKPYQRLSRAPLVSRDRRALMAGVAALSLPCSVLLGGILTAGILAIEAEVTGGFLIFLVAIFLWEWVSTRAARNATQAIAWAGLAKPMAPQT